MEEKNNFNFQKITLFVFVGTLIGIANGLFGGGGGMLCVPLLIYAGLSNKKAQATAILIMTPISIASAIIYYSMGNIDFMVLIYVMSGSILGSIIGASLLKKFSNIVLQYIFSIVMLIVGIKLLF